MDKQIITFSANEQNLVRIGGEYHYSSNKVSYIGAHFDLGANWDGFDSVRAVWFTDRINGISTVLDGEGNCTVPTEVLKKKDRVFVNLVGSIVSNGELTDRLTTYPAVALVVDSKAKVDSTETAPVTPSQFEQFVSIVQDAVANIKDIVSTTLNADYTLTFVYSDGTSYTTPSIRGERGPQGADGADGTDGNGIASAVLNSNYMLTLTFTDGTSYTTPSIRGAQGPKGDPGDVSQAQLDAAVSDLKSDLNEVRTNGTNQLFDKDSPILLNAYPTSSTQLSNETSGFRTLVVPIEGGEKITVHREEMLGRFAVFQFDGNYGYGATIKNYIADNSASVITIDTTNDAEYIGIFFYNQNVDGADTSVIDLFLNTAMVQYGERFTGYEQYYCPKGLSNIRYEESKTVYVGDNVLGASVTLGLGWAGTISDGFTHSSGSAGVLEINTTTVAGLAYLVEFDVSASSTNENALMVQLGNAEPADTYNGKTHRVAGFIATANAPIKFIADATYDKTITNIKVRAVGKGSNAVTLSLYQNAFTNDTHGNVCGFWNVALGDNALNRNIMGSRMIAIGYGSLTNIISGTRNIGVGTYSLTEAVDGDHNIAIGSDTGYRLQKPDDNIIIGYSAMAEPDSSNAKQNVAIGSYAIHLNRAGASDNVCVGHYAGRMASNNNVYIGSRAGYYIKGVKNVAVGDNAISNVYVGGNYNTVIGADSGIEQGTSQSDTAVTGSIAIGHAVILSESHTCIIGDSEIEKTMVTGDFIVRGTDGIRRKIVFNSDGSCSWIEVV